MSASRSGQERPKAADPHKFTDGASSMRKLVGHCLFFSWIHFTAKLE